MEGGGGADAFRLDRRYAGDQPGDALFGLPRRPVHRRTLLAVLPAPGVATSSSRLASTWDSRCRHGQGGRMIADVERRAFRRTATGVSAHV